MIYDDIDKTGMGMSFTDFVNVVLNMRGSNPATVKDVRQQLRFVKALVRDSLATLGGNIDAEFQKVHEVLQELSQRIVEDSDDGSEIDDLGAMGSDDLPGRAPVAALDVD